MLHSWRCFPVLAVALAIFAQEALLATGQPPPALPSPAGGSLFGSPLAGATRPVTVRAQFSVATAEQPARLWITAAIIPGWHIYSITQPPGGPLPTKIEVRPPRGIRVVGKFEPSAAPKTSKEPDAFGDLPIETHEGTITWYAPLDISPGTDSAGAQIDGQLKGLACSNACQPVSVAFSARLGPGVPLPKPPSAAPTPRPAPGAPVFNPSALKVAVNDEIRETPMLVAIGMGLLGGLILNLMPCVLPVIGLKVLSFFEQSGHDRRHALILNVWYSLGLISVFLVLATLAVTLGLGWGQLFSFSGFNITLTAVVFVMGLSFLGVWEFPIPGFVGRGKTLELAEKEGFAGAFSKGIITTILATPCSAPFLASALTWAVNQPPPKTYAVFTAAGVGMASPYLLIGAFPRLLGFLPKPGAWMDTFKQVMGFVLLATVVFLLTFEPAPLVVPTVGLLFGLWGACWWIGRGSPTADTATKVRRWLEAAIFAGAVWIVTFGWLANVMRGYFDRAVEQAIAKQLLTVTSSGTGMVETPVERRPSMIKKARLVWQPYSRKMLESAIAVGSTVLVDFTADWCLTCKALEAAVLNTQQVCDTVAANRIVTLHADWTHADPEVTQMLDALGSKQVPVLAIFPAGNPNEPIVFRGGYSRQELIDALMRAGPSKPR